MQLKDKVGHLTLLILHRTREHQCASVESFGSVLAKGGVLDLSIDVVNDYCSTQRGSEVPRESASLEREALLCGGLGVVHGINAWALERS
jgi:hypothetical protein